MKKSITPCLPWVSRKKAKLRGLGVGLEEGVRLWGPKNGDFGYPYGMSLNRAGAAVTAALQVESRAKVAGGPVKTAVRRKVGTHFCTEVRRKIGTRFCTEDTAVRRKIETHFCTKVERKIGTRCCTEVTVRLSCVVVVPAVRREESLTARSSDSPASVHVLSERSCWGCWLRAPKRARYPDTQNSS